MVGVTPEEYPAIMAVAKDGSKFLYRGDFDPQNVTTFLSQVDAGHVERTVRSAEAVDDTDTPVKVVVAKTAQDRIFAQTKTDVLLEIFAPWCGHCKALAPMMRQLGEYVAEMNVADLLMIAQYDGTANDAPHPDVQWSSFPTLYYIPAGGSPRLYEGDLTARAMWKWIKAHHSQRDVITARVKLAKEAKATPHSEL
jgi:thiol-disulfide isomerase/thioredoxin